MVAVETGVVEPKVELDAVAMASAPTIAGLKVVLGAIAGAVIGVIAGVVEWALGWIGGWAALGWLAGLLAGGAVSGGVVGWVRGRRRAVRLMLIESRLVELVVRKLTARAAARGEALAAAVRSTIDEQLARLPGWARGTAAWFTGQLSAYLTRAFEEKVGDPVERAHDFVGDQIDGMNRGIERLALLAGAVLLALPAIVFFA